MKLVTHTERPMHRILLDVPCEDDPRLLESRYERYIERTTRFMGIPVWLSEHSVQRHPIHKFVNHCINGGD